MRKGRAKPEPATMEEALLLAASLFNSSLESLRYAAKEESGSRSVSQDDSAVLKQARSIAEEMIVKLFDPDRCVVIRQLPAEHMSGWAVSNPQG